MRDVFSKRTQTWREPSRSPAAPSLESVSLVEWSPSSGSLAVS